MNSQGFQRFDVHAGNILIRDGRLLFTDFGLALCVLPLPIQPCRAVDPVRAPLGDGADLMAQYASIAVGMAEMFSAIVQDAPAAR